MRTGPIIFLVCLACMAAAALAQVHEGDFTVAAGQTETLRGIVLEVEGNVILGEGSTLVMENATLLILERYKSEHTLQAKNANISLTNSTIKSEGNMMVRTYGDLMGAELNLLCDGGTIDIRNSTVYGRFSLSSSSLKILGSTVSFVYWMFDSDVEIEDSLLGAFVFNCNTPTPGDMLLEGLVVGGKTNLAIGGLPDGGSLALRDVEVRSPWAFNFDVGCSKNVTIRDSAFDNLWIKFPPTDERITITGLPSGQITEFELKGAVSGIGLDYGVRLVNTSLQKFKPEMLSTKAEITNSHAMVHSYDRADLVIRNSTLYSFFNYGSERVEFFDSRLVDNTQFIYKPEFAAGRIVDGKVLGEGGHVHLVFHNTTIDSQAIVVANKDGVIEGDVTILSPKSLDSVQWVQGTIVRTYPVFAWPGAELTLAGEGGVVWSGKAGEDGAASFNLAFDNATYAREYELASGNSTAVVGFLSDTPLVLAAPGSGTAPAGLEGKPQAGDGAKPESGPAAQQGPGESSEGGQGDQGPVLVLAAVMLVIAAALGVRFAEKKSVGRN